MEDKKIIRSEREDMTTDTVGDGHSELSQQTLPIDSIIRKQFDIPDVDIRTYSPLALAYIGDGIFDLVIRSIVVGRGNTGANQLHHRTSHIVKAHTQARMIEKLEEYLTAEEQGIYRRGRNAKSPTMAKNATMADYRKATGFEALMGYLYLTDNFSRILELTQLAAEKLKIRL